MDDVMFSYHGTNGQNPALNTVWQASVIITSSVAHGEVCYPRLPL